MKNLFNRQALVNLATMFWAIVFVSSTASYAADSAAPIPFGSELILTIDVKLAPIEDMGVGSDGHRINYPIVGGSFVGKGLKGNVVPGGADLSVEDNHGTTRIDALYRLKTDDGQIIIIHNYGIWRPNAAGLAKIAKGEELGENDYYCFTIPSFKTPPGNYEWMTKYVYIGTIDDTHDGVLINVYKISEPTNNP